MNSGESFAGGGKETDARALRIICWTCAALPALAAAGCGGAGAPALAVGLQSENPAERVDACIRAAQAQDASVLGLLVERLEDASADVRFFAIQALERMTGQTLGYRYYDAPEARRQSAWRWREWLKANVASGDQG